MCAKSFPLCPIFSYVSPHSPPVFERPPALLECDDLVAGEVLDALVQLLHRQHGQRVVGDHRRLGRGRERRVKLARGSARRRSGLIVTITVTKVKFGIRKNLCLYLFAGDLSGVSVYVFSELALAG